jgi:hypothetical protein
VIEIYQRRPAYVEMILWDGSADSFYEIRDWVGISPDVGGPGFRFNAHDIAEVYNGEEHGWIPTPVGHRIVKGPVGEFYPISPAALALSYGPVVAQPWEKIEAAH